MMIITVLLDGDAEYTEIDWQVNTKPLIKFTLDRILNVVAIQIDGDELQWVLDRWPQFVG